MSLYFVLLSATLNSHWRGGGTSTTLKDAPVSFFCTSFYNIQYVCRRQAYIPSGSTLCTRVGSLVTWGIQMQEGLGILSTPGLHSLCSKLHCYHWQWDPLFQSDFLPSPLIWIALNHLQALTIHLSSCSSSHMLSLQHLSNRQPEDRSW